MRQLNFTETTNAPYKFLGAMLAPKGAFYLEYSKDNKELIFYPIMYIQLWQDPNGVVWNVPLWAEEVQETFDDSKSTFQEFIEMIINEDRHVETCLTCNSFIYMCRRLGRVSENDICLLMDELDEDIVTGRIGATPELLEYFKHGAWGNLRTMKNDGTLDYAWKETFLADDGSLKSDVI